ncbi:MAG: SGNH/GDSL hydrolase family protein [Actinobacteria bacterium]|nr:SGNH/GDSL hydrolase family protein [Actinomycetota bacterium]
MRGLVAVLLALAVLGGVTGAYRHPGAPEPTAPLSFGLNRVAVIGDSYTTGGDEGGTGANGWTAIAWQILAREGVPTTTDVAAERGAGYAARGEQGRIFQDLARGALRPDDTVVVFFGSRNDEHADPLLYPVMVYSTFQLARRMAPNARFLVIGPPWPTADPPGAVLRIRDALEYQAGLADATFVDPIAAGWFVGRPDLIGQDGIHPTDSGHAYLADQIAPLIGAQLP